MTNRVFVLDTDRIPFMPCHPARARQLLRAGRASVYRKAPFTIVLHDRTVDGSATQPTRAKVDPGSKTTGLALVADFARRGPTVIWAGDLHHRGDNIRKALADRRNHCRNRRGRKTRYRKPRFQNRCRTRGWLPPSVQHRVDTTLTWVARLRRWSPVTALRLERAKFDTQLLENPDLAGVDYQRGALYGYERRQFLLERHRHTCAYCNGMSGDPVLETEHVHPRSRGGSDRVANLVIACTTCNRTKDNRTAGEWAEVLDRRGKLNRTRKINAEAIQAGQRPSLRDAAAVNAVRNALADQFRQTDLPVEWGTGGRTKFNRTGLGYPKAHWIDAACVGGSGASVRLDPDRRPLTITATGHGERRRARLDRNGFPRGHKPRARSFQGVRTGDRVKVVSGKARGSTGRIRIRFRPSFVLDRAGDRVDGVHPRHIVVQQRSDGYAYA